MSIFSAYERRVFRRCILIGLCVTAIAVSLERMGAIAWLEYRLYDERAAVFQWHSICSDSKVVHVDLDDASIHEIGRWPWKRSVLAEVIDELSLAGAKAIALDILLDEPAEPSEVCVASESTEPENTPTSRIVARRVLTKDQRRARTPVSRPRWPGATP